MGFIDITAPQFEGRVFSADIMANFKKLLSTTTDPLDVKFGSVTTNGINVSGNILLSKVNTYIGSTTNQLFINAVSSDVVLQQGLSATGDLVLRGRRNILFQDYDASNADRVSINTATGDITSSGRIIVDDTTDATTTLDGSLQTDGGLSVAKSAIIGGKLNFGSATELTIANGAITITKSFHTVDTEGNAGSDDLTTINGGSEGDILVLKLQATGRTVIVKDGGNLAIAGDFTMNNSQDTIVLMHYSSSWIELTRSDNN